MIGKRLGIILEYSASIIRRKNTALALRIILASIFSVFGISTALVSSIKTYSTMAWFDYLSQFSFEIQHISGIENAIPNSLSRLYSCELNTMETVQVFPIQAIEKSLRDVVDDDHAMGHNGANNMVKLLKLRYIRFNNMKEYCTELIKICTTSQMWSNSIPKFSPVSPVLLMGRGKE